jgi:hypothetical protein
VRHEVTGAFALIGALLSVRSWRREPDARAWLVVFGSTLALFLANAAYWSQHNAFIAGPHSVLVAFAVASFTEWLAESQVSARRLIALAALAVVALPGVERAFRAPLNRGNVAPIVPLLRQAAANSGCVLPFEPAWGLAAGLLPWSRPGLSPLVDPYAAMLLGAMGEGRRFADAGEAFRSEGAQAIARPYLDQCQLVALGWRGHWQLGEAGTARVAARLVRLNPEADPKAIDVWGAPP